MQVKDKVVIVTGASSGIGEETVRPLVRRWNPVSLRTALEFLRPEAPEWLRNALTR